VPPTQAPVLALRAIPTIVRLIRTAAADYFTRSATPEPRSMSGPRRFSPVTALRRISLFSILKARSLHMTNSLHPGRGRDPQSPGPQAAFLPCRPATVTRASARSAVKALAGVLSTVIASLDDAGEAMLRREV
jgi:hypothetical protein